MSKNVIILNIFYLFLCNMKVIIIIIIIIDNDNKI